MTNGIVSLVDGGTVLVKVVAGCSGYNAELLAERIKAGDLRTKEEIYAAAREVSFGCADCLVVQDRDGHICEDDEPLYSLYTEKFADPLFNPRRESGLVEHVKVIEL